MGKVFSALGELGAMAIGGALHVADDTAVIRRRREEGRRPRWARALDGNRRPASRTRPAWGAKAAGTIPVRLAANKG
jgi:hypothetical protein